MPGTMSDLPFPQSEDEEDEDENGVEVKGEGVEGDDRFFGLLHLLPPAMIQFVEVRSSFLVKPRRPRTRRLRPFSVLLSNSKNTLRHVPISRTIRQLFPQNA